MRRKLILTADGSPTFQLSHQSETYHSKNGALTESLHVFIERGMNHWLKLNSWNSTLDILEMGFGTGLNCILTITKLKGNHLEVSYDAIEAYPLSFDEVASFSRNKSFNTHFSSQKLLDLHKLSWNDYHELELNIRVKKIKSKVQNFSFQKKYDLIYYDAFAKFLQPELWTSEFIQSMTSSLNSNGVFITYAAFADLRDALKKSNMKIERLKGPLGKREITRAIKC
ncbi:MAG: tRNA (5-methylaminomethyl-2-thiouridine)(34)-methyltransferase MnmD [Flavobacteriaceae bacterium]|nr:tRNA (5-methylaminomethyl-2-thiouridine)(34)-methyltransferase MnmD [Flavobacteriaceae bacterium]MCY4297792.1 tRNA (5-methylaminomethyl-2-thiouridine)(34)-methyltransferase MnmD [Flavobacteriaceae bacterium]